jgi:DNA-binding CsgD family transcriptional regulator
LLRDFGNWSNSRCSESTSSSFSVNTADALPRPNGTGLNDGLLGIIDFLRGRIAYERHDLEKARTLLLDNHPNKLIARRLKISEATVKFHLINIYRKLGVGTRSDAKALARERRLVISSTP